MSLRKLCEDYEPSMMGTIVYNRMGLGKPVEEQHQWPLAAFRDMKTDTLDVKGVVLRGGAYGSPIRDV